MRKKIQGKVNASKVRENQQKTEIGSEIFSE
jgi:hypothetical protein